MDSGAVRLLGMGELYFSPSSASYLVCHPQGVTCSNAAFAHYKPVHILILTNMWQCHQWVKQINEKLDWGGGLLGDICQERSRRAIAITLLPWLESLCMTLQLCMIFATFSVWQVHPPLMSQLSFTPLLLLIPGDCTCLILTSYFKLIESNFSVSLNDCIGQHQDLN